jgi:TnpA family transposase
MGPEPQHAAWHVRYGGRGVMIYWHNVERSSLCIGSPSRRRRLKWFR